MEIRPKSFLYTRDESKVLFIICLILSIFCMPQLSFSQTTDRSSGITNRAQELANSLTASNFEYPWKVEVFDLPISSNSVAYRVYVRLPIGPLNEGEKPSSFYFLDPLALFTPAAAMSYNYEFLRYVPPAYFIGIGYQDEAD
ncbi:MAG: hypothetical protein QGG54_15625, partial [Gammaproteobacteria bacterium]|nr:hypothetical protein [Gammaproteobacteria bacterium]